MIKDDYTKTVYSFENGKPQFIYYKLNGKLHREDGPAKITYYRDGEVAEMKYYIMGKELKKDEYEEYAKEFFRLQKLEMI